MQWIFENFQVVAVVFLIVGSLVKRFLEAKAEERQARERMDEEREEDVFGPDEEWRTPADPAPSVPPPLGRQSPPPLFRQAPSPPALPVEDSDIDLILQRQREMEERLRQHKAAKSGSSRATTTGGAAATQDRMNPRRPGSPAERAGSLRAALKNREETRRAVVLREVLGPPLGLR